ncbi:MAG: hypothetical protein KAT65_07520, partial [Methanophagales archaeon]|nr:hypothetical protein [Methanophagales archaeon]
MMPTKAIILGVIVALVSVMVIAITFTILIQHEQPKPVEPKIKTKDMQKTEVGGRIKLPEPSYTGNTSVETALSKRRSIRDYSGENLTLDEVSQL